MPTDSPDPKPSRSSPAVIAARRAVYDVLLHRRTQEETLADDVEKLQRRWRQWLYKLQALDWKATQRGTLPVLYNCPPFGIVTASALPCTRATVCPFCYGRKFVMGAFRHLETLIYGSPRGRESQLPEGTRLLSFNYREQYTHPDQGSEEQWQRWLARFQRFLRHPALRHSELGQFHTHLGGVLRQFIELGPHKLTFRRQGLLLIVPYGGGLSAYRGLRSRLVQTVHAPTRRQLIEVMSRSFRYPRGHLYGQAERLPAVLAAMEHARLLVKLKPCTEEPREHIESES